MNEFIHNFPEKEATIAARATAMGTSGIGVIRISGARTQDIAKAILGTIPQPRRVIYASFRNKKGACLDEGLAIFFNRPYSFTGEDVLELHGHGSPMALTSLLETVLEQGARLARPGEFSERAFLNGKIDLLKAEAIADLIYASSEEGARAAARSLQGEFSKTIIQLREKVIRLQMEIEADIDFPEEGIPTLTHAHIFQTIVDLHQQILELQVQAKQGILLKDGVNLVIVGKPNVGKSSLLNYLSGEDRAIVTEISGTTRDVLRETLLLEGIPIHLSDTAGLRSTEDEIEREGIHRAKTASQRADLVFLMMDAIEEPIDNMDQATKELCSFLGIHADMPRIIIRNKIDLTEESPKVVETGKHIIVNMSIKNKQGYSVLLEQLKKVIGFQPSESGTFSARKRHLLSIAAIERKLLSAKMMFSEPVAWELLAEELRHAQHHLSEILGEFTSDDLLGKIFSEFCIGK